MKITIKPIHQLFMLMIGIILIALLIYHFVLAKTLAQPEIDQLLMQATFGKDQQSLQKLKDVAESHQVEAELALAKVYIFKHQSAQAEKWLEQAAQQGNHEAAMTLGKLYFHGDEHIAKNYHLALQWFKQAYAAQDSTAAYYLGLMYKNGYGVDIQPTQAVQYFQFAANQQIPSAMFMLANAYQFGDGVNVDLKQALHWYQAAADLELPEAIQELAHIYQYGNSAVHADQTAYQQQLLEIGHSLKHPALTP